MKQDIADMKKKINEAVENAGQFVEKHQKSDNNSKRLKKMPKRRYTNGKLLERGGVKLLS